MRRSIHWMAIRTRVIGPILCAMTLGGHITAVAGVPEAGRQAGIVLPSDAEVREILRDRVVTLAGEDAGIGIVVGVIGPQGRRVISYGRLDRNDPRALDGDTVFEIGSMGKVFTALLLADMVRRDEVALSDPVAKHLPAGIRVPERNGRSITLLDLATHTSGLPFMPDELPVYDDKAAARYGATQLYQFLARYQLTRDPGADWDYSNVGYWLLGQALASRSGMDYADLLRTRVTGPLKLEETALTLSPRLKAHLAVGHNAILGPAPSVSSVSVYAAMQAGGVGCVSSVHDLLTFLAVAMSDKPSPLAQSMALMLSTRRPMGEDEQALGWGVLGKGDDRLIMHDGATWGYNGYMAWDPKRRVGVVVLSNQLASIGDIGRHLLQPSAPLERPTVTRHTETTLEAARLDACAGTYDADEEGIFSIVREHDFLTLQLPIAWGLPKFRLRPESRSDFFVAELPIRVTCQSDGDARATGVLVYPPRGQRGVQARRVGNDRQSPAATNPPQ